MTVRAFLLDDHEVVRAGLKHLLESSHQIQVVAEAGTVADAWPAVQASRPDVAILDARLPDGSGIEVCREIRSHMPEVPAMILTSYDDEDAVFAAIMAGAQGYLLKQVTGNNLVHAVLQVAAGQSMLDAQVTSKVMHRLRSGNEDPAPELADLTPQERRILELVAEGMTNRQIGERLCLAEKTVKNYMSNVLSKLGLSRRTQAAVYAQRVLGKADV